MSDFESILAVIGSSFFPSDVSSDLKEIKQTLNKSEESARHHNNAVRENQSLAGDEDTATFNVLNACFHAVCGRFKRASQYLKLVKDDLDSLPRAWTLHVSLIETYLKHLRRHPLPTDIENEVGTARTIRDSTIWSMKDMQDFYSETLKMEDEMREIQFTDLLKLEMTCLRDHIASHTVIEMAAYPLHPAYPPVGLSTPERLPDFRRQVDRRLSRLQNTLRMAAELRLYPVVEYVQSSIYRYLHASNRDEASAILGGVEMIYEKSGQLSGRAMCKMLAADALVSPPWTSPVTFNLIPVDSGGFKTSNPLWDASEDNIMLKSIPEADHLYDQAYQLFAQANCVRGCALILLRQSAFSMISLCSSTMQNETEFHEKVESVSNKLEKVMEYLSEDEARLQIARGHRLLLGVISGVDGDKLREIAGDIGAWGLENMNEGVSQFIGFLFVRFGRRQWLDHSRVDIAEKCFRHAYHLFIQLDDVVSAVKAVGALVEIFDWLRDDVNTKVFLSENLHVFSDAINRIDLYVSLSDDRKHITDLLSFSKLILVQYLPTIPPIFRRVHDYKGLAQWENVVSELNTSSEIRMSALVDAQATPGTQEHWFLRENIRQESLLFEEVYAFKATYDKAIEDYSKLTRRNNAVDAIEVMEDFIRRTEQMPGSLSIKYHTLTIASCLIGKLRESRQYLAMLSQEQLMGGPELETAPMFVCDAPWCRNRWPSRLGDSDSVELALSTCVQARDWDRARDVMDQVLEACPGFYEPEGPNRTTDQANRFKWAGLTCEHSMRYMLAFKHYSDAANIYTTQRRWVVDNHTKTSFYSLANVAEVFVGLARVALICLREGVPFQTLNLTRLISLSFESWEELIVAVLEEGKARALFDSLDAGGLANQRTSTTVTTKSAYQERLLTHLKALPPDSTSDAEKREMVELKRNLPPILNNLFQPFTNPLFSQLSTVAGVCSSIQQDALVVQVSFSTYGSLMTALTSRGIEMVVPLEGSIFHTRFQAQGVMKSIKDYSCEYENLCKGKSMAEITERLRVERDLLEAQLSDVSRIVIDPIKELIRKKRHIIFCGAQYLSGFPLAALELDGVPLFHLAAVSLTPSLSVHHQLHKRAPRVEAQVTAIAKPGSLRDYMFSRELPLPYSGIEAMLITNLFGTWPVMAKKTTNDEFVHLMEISTIMHVGTHGKLHPESPYLSSISLEEAFRVLELSRCKTNAALVVFSACLSGIGNNTLGNDVEGFTHAVLETGTMAFIGALWEVSDIGTMILMVLFYRAITGRLDFRPVPESMRPDLTKNRTLAELWRAASLVFYHFDGQKARNLIIEFIFEIQERQQRTGDNPNTIVKNWKSYLEELLVEPRQAGEEEGKEKASLLDLIDFKHPFFYASFIPVGYGDLEIALPRSATSPRVMGE